MNAIAGNAPGTQPAHFIQNKPPGNGGDTVEPGRQPDEIVPDEGDTDNPSRTPDEVSPDQGDFDRPGRSPDELPAQPDGRPVQIPPPD